MPNIEKSKEYSKLFSLVGYISDESSSDDTPLINLTKNKKRFKKDNTLKKISKKLKQSALKRLSNANSCHVKNTKKTNSQRQEPNKKTLLFS